MKMLPGDSDSVKMIHELLLIIYDFFFLIFINFSIVRVGQHTEERKMELW